jgi:copper chaperone CopZ
VQDGAPIPADAATNAGAGTPPVTGAAELAVDGMHCASCAALVEEVLTEHDGVTSATVDLDAARASVRYDPARVDVAGLVALVADAGYAATPTG